MDVMNFYDNASDQIQIFRNKIYNIDWMLEDNYLKEVQNLEVKQVKHEMIAYLIASDVLRTFDDQKNEIEHITERKLPKIYNLILQENLKEVWENPDFEDVMKVALKSYID